MWKTSHWKRIILQKDSEHETTTQFISGLCFPNPCQNNGNCTDEVFFHICQCVPGYTGDNCETNIDECGSSPCQNGGACKDLGNVYNCSCPNDYDGTNCENYNICYGITCQNDGTCVGGSCRVRWCTQWKLLPVPRYSTKQLNRLPCKIIRIWYKFLTTQSISVR